MPIQYDGRPGEPEFVSGEPAEGDYTTEDHRTFYQYGKRVVVVAEGEDWCKAVAAHSAANNFFPDVWFISDHGNAHLIN
jgi:hypothetical protein